MKCRGHDIHAKHATAWQEVFDHMKCQADHSYTDMDGCDDSWTEPPPPARAPFDDGNYRSEERMTSVANPYWTEKDLAKPEASMAFRTFAAAGVAVTLASAMAYGFVGLITLTVFLAGLFAIGRRMRKANDDYWDFQSRKAEQAVIGTSSLTFHPMRVISDSIGELSSDQRAEVQPLWEAACEAAAILTTAPDNEIALGALNARAEAVQKLARVEADLQLAEAEAVLSASLNQIDRGDLATVAAMIESRQTGVDTYRALTTPQELR